jgi:hypothetical protein
MGKTGDRQETELTEQSAFRCRFSAKFITRSNESWMSGAHPHRMVRRLGPSNRGPGLAFRPY